MVPLSRRQLLRAVTTAGAVTVAGCNGRGGRQSPTPSPEPDGRPTADYDALSVRNPTGESFVRYGDSGAERPTDDEPRSNDPPSEPSYVGELLATAADAERIAFTADVDGVDDARRFLDETDFERDVVYVHERPVSECRALAVSYVTTDADSFDLEFCSPLRPADVACEVDRRDVVVALVRFPLATDGISSHSIGGGGGCERPPRERREGPS
ncbi:hypothetical protein [Salinigranum salinum]|uniref:hypothetical protein n=1 Tax=Salinigranum salinum TaxID=1364937 RepID=UPI0012609252|nr:hypothetical protein [Salinigranum salinum]